MTGHDPLEPDRTADRGRRRRRTRRRARSGHHRRAASRNARCRARRARPDAPRRGRGRGRGCGRGRPPGGGDAGRAIDGRRSGGWPQRPTDRTWCADVPPQPAYASTDRIIGSASVRRRRWNRFDRPLRSDHRQSRPSKPAITGAGRSGHRRRVRRGGRRRAADDELDVLDLPQRGHRRPVDPDQQSLRRRERRTRTAAGGSS